MCRKINNRLVPALVTLLWLESSAMAWGQAAPASAPGQSPPAVAASPAQVFPDLPPLPGVIPEAQSIRITTSVDRAAIRVGDLIHYSLMIETPKGSKVIMPPPGAQLGEFLIRDYSFPGLLEKEESWSDGLRRWLSEKTGVPISEEGAAGQEFHFTITAYDTGDLVIPPLPVVVVDPGGGKHLLFAESARIRVVPVTNPEDLTIRDIKAPAALPFPVTRYLAYVLVPLAVLAAVIIAVWRFRRQKEEEEETAPMRPAHEIAMEDLLQLEAENLPASEEYERFYTRLSWILRRYLALRYYIYALEYTTPEIMQKLKIKDIPHAEFEKARRLLEEADKVKFARCQPGLEERNTAISRAREIIEQTREHEAEDLEMEAA